MQDNKKIQQKTNLKTKKMQNSNVVQTKKSVKDLKIEDLKKFITEVQQSQNAQKTFKPERLQNLRETNFSRKYNSGFSN